MSYSINLKRIKINVSGIGAEGDYVDYILSMTVVQGMKIALGVI